MRILLRPGGVDREHAPCNNYHSLHRGSPASSFLTLLLWCLGVCAIFTPQATRAESLLFKKGSVTSITEDNSQYSVTVGRNTYKILKKKFLPYSANFDLILQRYCMRRLSYYGSSKDITLSCGSYGCADGQLGQSSFNGCTVGSQVVTITSIKSWLNQYSPVQNSVRVWNSAPYGCSPATIPYTKNDSSFSAYCTMGNATTYETWQVSTPQRVNPGECVDHALLLATMQQYCLDLSRIY